MKRMMKATLCAVVMMLFLYACAQAEIHFGPPPEDWQDKDVLEWTIFDTNEGDAMLLRCGGESMMVDGGPKPYREQLRDALAARGLERSMKYFFSTHYHDDHIDGLYYLMRYGFTAGEFLHGYKDSFLKDEERLYRTIRQAQHNQIPLRQVHDGDLLTLGGAQLHVLHCTELFGANARSLVLKVTFGESSLLLCADITGEVQRYFMENRQEGILKADIIKIPHHGLVPAVPEFLDTVMPGAAVVTNEKKTVFSQSMSQLKGRAIPAFLSGEGAVRAVTDGTDWYIEQAVGCFDPQEMPQVAPDKQ
ncbi:MAG: MBL fold metallo-hydrolase [Clostridia bacterium]|nr:MBL fold metallo-hydrolase [Clostridia bacterium]